METFCTIIALQLILGFVIIPFYLFTRVYYYFIPSFIHAYVTDKFEVINELNKTRFLILTILLFCSFFFGISSTKIILSFDNSHFTFLTAIKIQFLTIIFLILQFFICYSIEKKIPNNLFDFIDNLKDKDYKWIQLIYDLIERENHLNHYKTKYLKSEYNVKIINMKQNEINKNLLNFTHMFENKIDLKEFSNLMRGKEINRKIDLNVKVKYEAYRLFSQFFIFYSKDGSRTVDINDINSNHINFLNKNFTLNGLINPLHINDKRSMK